MIKKWKFFKNTCGTKEETKENMGYCYAVRFKVMPGFYLTKIGATSCFKNRLSNIPNVKLFCISPLHYNYFENECILHEYFKKYRVPRKPNGKSQVELFNIDLPYFLKNLPEMNYETEISNCIKCDISKSSFYYKSKK